MKTTILFSIISFALINLFSSCHKPKNEYVEMIFKLPLSITPTKDTISVGDTLILEANFPDSLKEEFSGKYYILKDFDFETRISFYVFLNNSKSLYLSEEPGATGAFIIINEFGGITGLSETFGGVGFVHENNIYKLKTKIVPSQKGVFAISFYSKLYTKNMQLNFLDLGQNSSGGKKIAVIDNIWYLINNGNTDYEKLRNYTKLASDTYPTPDNVNGEQQATYTFVVK